MLKLHRLNRVLDVLLIAIVTAALAIAIGHSATRAARAADSVSPGSATPAGLQGASATVVTAGASRALAATADEKGPRQQARRRDGSGAGTPGQTQLRLRDGSCGLDGAANGTGAQRRNGPGAMAGVFTKSAKTQRPGASCAGGQRSRQEPGAAGCGWAQGSRRGSASQAAARGNGGNRGSRVNTGDGGRGGTCSQARNRQQHQGQQRGRGSSGGQARGHGQRGGAR